VAATELEVLMFYRWLADLLATAHVGYVLFVVLGLCAIYLGRLLGWVWVHNRWFRSIHFLMIAVVAFEAIFGLACPLTTWEDGLRELSGDKVSGVSFVERMMHSLLFPDLPRWVFPLLHIGFAVIVLSTFWLVPVRWREDNQRTAESAKT
jgi:hypothetical protein